MPLPVYLYLPFVTFAIISIVVYPLIFGCNKTYINKTIYGLLLVFLSGSLLWMTGNALVYLFSSGYMDHAEANIAAVAWASMKLGQPLYHDLSDGYRYSLAYGPLLYIFTSWAYALFGGAVTVSKLVPVMGTVVAMYASYLLFRPHSGKLLALGLVGFLAVTWNFFPGFTYWVRGDSLLQLFTVLAIMSVERGRPAATALLLAVLGAMMINIKVHAGIYLLPALSVYLLHHHQPKHIMLLATGIVFLAVPFLYPQIALSGFAGLAGGALEQGLSSSYAILNVSYCLPFFVPVFIGFIYNKSGHLGKEGWVYFWALLVTTLIVTIIGSKPGSGAHHYLPLLPAVMYFIIRYQAGAVFTDSRGKTRATNALLLSISTGLCLAYLPETLKSQKTVVEYIKARPVYARFEEEVRGIADELSPGTVAMGYTDHSTYMSTFAAPLLTFSGSPYLLDAPTLNELDFSGQEMPDATIELLDDCAVDYWLVPSYGSLFSLENVYPTDREIFPSRFVNAFYRNYRKVRTVEFYTIWKCKHS